MTRLDKKFLILFILISVFFLVASIYYYHKTVQNGKDIPWVDFRVYYYAGFRLEEGTNIYDLNDGYFIYKYSPIFALIMSVIRFSNATLADALVSWYMILFCSLTISLYLIKEILADSERNSRFRLLDIIPLLFILRYVVVINFTKKYILTELPIYLQYHDKILLYLLTPAYLASFLFKKKGKGESNYFAVISLALLSVMQFLLLNIDRAQVNIVIMMLLFFFIYYLYRNSGILAGLYLGIAIVFRLYPVIFLIYLLIKKKFIALSVALITFTSLVILPSFKLGLERNLGLIKNWIGVLQLTLPSEYLQYKNQSLLAMMSRYFSKNSDISILGLDNSVLTISIIFVYSFFLLFLVYWSMRKIPGESASTFIYDVSLFLISMTLLSPVAAKTTFIYMLFPIAVLIRELFRRRFKDRFLKFGFLLYLILSYGNSSDVIGKFSILMHKYSLGAFCILLLFVMIIYAKFSRSNLDITSYV